MNSKYVIYDQIASAMPDCVRWSEAAIIAVGRYTNSPLKFVRVGNRRSPAMWRRDDVITWFAHIYRQAPELALEFRARLQLSKLPTKAKHKTKGEGSS